MSEVVETPEFTEWLSELADSRARAKIVARIRRLQFGNPGDVEPVGAGVSELRVHYGPGYRVYFVQKGKRLVILLCGGAKKSQVADIKRAKALAEEYT